MSNTILLAASTFAFAVVTAIIWGKATKAEDGSPDYATGAILGGLLGPFGLVAALYRLYQSGGANIKSWFSQTAKLAGIVALVAIASMVLIPAMNDDGSLSDEDLATATKSIKSHYEAEKSAKNVSVSATKETAGKASAIVVATMDGSQIGVSCTIIKDGTTKMISWSCR